MRKEVEIGTEHGLDKSHVETIREHAEKADTRRRKREGARPRFGHEVSTSVTRLIRLMYPISCSQSPNQYPVLYSNLMPISLPPTAFSP